MKPFFTPKPQTVSLKDFGATKEEKSTDAEMVSEDGGAERWDSLVGDLSTQEKRELCDYLSTELEAEESDDEMPEPEEMDSDPDAGDEYA